MDKIIDNTTRKVDNMKIDKKLFALTKIASKYRFRPNLNSVHLKREGSSCAAIVTDGYRLLKAEWEGNAEKEDFKITLEKDLFEAIGKTVPKNGFACLEKSTPDSALMSVQNNGVITKTEIKNVPNFPDVESIMSKNEPKAQVWVNAKYLAEIAKILNTISESRSAMISIEIFEEERPIRITLDEKIKCTSFLMPMRKVK